MLMNDMSRVLISREEIDRRVSELAKKICAEYADKNAMFVCILKGAAFFFTDLIRQLNIPLEIDFMAISSYGKSARTTGEVKMVKDINSSAEGRHIVIVEDIVDSGLTLSYLKQLLTSRGALSVSICTLLDKPTGRKVEIVADYCGFEVDDCFVVGYGLDYAEKYRNLPEICELKKEIYSK